MKVSCLVKDVEKVPKDNIAMYINIMSTIISVKLKAVNSEMI